MPLLQSVGLWALRTLRYPRTARPLDPGGAPSLSRVAAGRDTATAGRPASGKAEESGGLRAARLEASRFAAESYVNVLVEAGDGSLQLPHGHQHVLDHVVLLIQLPDGLSLGELQQRDLGRDHPAKEPAEHWIVAERDDVLRKCEHTRFFFNSCVCLLVGMSRLLVK